MDPSDSAPFDPGAFAGRVRLFPLPNLVLFPHVLQPLHVFEPRYRALTEDALEGDGCIAMALLTPGWEAHYEGRPPLYPVACLGRIASHQRLPDGRYNLLLAGLKRVGLVRELEPTRPFREAEARLYDDVYPSKSAGRRPALQRRLLETFKRLLANLPAPDSFEQLMAGSLSLGMLTDIVAYTLDLDLPTKERLLRECDVDRRATLLLDHLDPSGGPSTLKRPSSGNFPPDFSAN